MDKLNYFNGHHENDLTRAYLTLLRHSCISFFSFLMYCKSKHQLVENEKEFSIFELIAEGYEIRTQVGSLQIDTNYILSVLITDRNLNSENSSVQPSERGAIYDGIVSCGNTLTIIIENKPRFHNVWLEQLNPSQNNIEPDTIIFSKPCILEWKEVVKQLSALISLPALAGNEKMMLEDFLSYVDNAFPFLNPFDKFHQCKNNPELLDRRVKNLLLEIALNEDSVMYQRGWGNYIQTIYPQIRMIGLILVQEGEEWWLELSLYFGNTQAQAISFYSSEVNINHLDTNEWNLEPNFHVSFMTSNLVHFPTEDYNTYLKFWKSNISKIYQQKRQDVPRYLDELISHDVIKSSEEIEEELDEKFYSTKKQTLNICPGFGIIYKILSKDAENLDRKGKLSELIKEKIFEGLKTVGLDGKDLIQVQ